MKLRGACGECPIDVSPNGSLTGWFEVTGDIGEHGEVVGQCPQGHAIAVVNQAPTYSLLFDAACLALGDRYHREAIATFAAALERFHAFAFRVIARHLQVDPQTIDAVWKPMGRRSEQQFGAFSAAFVIAFKTPPKKWNGEQLRNDVVHNGYFASHAQALQFGEDCYKRIVEVTLQLVALDKNAMDCELRESFAARAAAQRGHVTTHHSYVSPMVPPTMGGVPQSFEVALKTFLFSREFGGYGG